MAGFNFLLRGDEMAVGDVSDNQPYDPYFAFYGAGSSIFANNSKYRCVPVNIDTENGTLALLSFDLTVGVCLPANESSQSITLHCAITKTLDAVRGGYASVSDWISQNAMANLVITKNVSPISQQYDRYYAYAPDSEYTKFTFSFAQLGSSVRYSENRFYLWFWSEQSTNAVVQFYLITAIEPSDYFYKITTTMPQFENETTYYYYYPQDWGPTNVNQTDFYIDVLHKALKPNDKTTIALTGMDGKNAALSFRYNGTEIFNKSATSGILVFTIPSTIFADANAESEELIRLDILATRNDSKTANANITVLKPNSTAFVIDSDHFPDDIFRKFVSEILDVDGDGILTSTERSAVLSIDCSHSHEVDTNEKIVSLVGIEYFPNLENLNCQYNAIQALDTSSLTRLKNLQCYHNAIESLDLSSNTDLQRLIAYNNKLTDLDVTALTDLTYLNVEYNDLETLDCSQNSSLKNLYVTGNHLLCLNINGASDLEGLLTAGNKISTLNIHYCDTLIGLVKTVAPELIDDEDHELSYEQYKYKQNSLPILQIDPSTRILTETPEISPSIILQPSDKNVPIGDPVFFTVKATGPNLLCRWYKYWTNGIEVEHIMVYPGVDWEEIGYPKGGDISGDVTTFEIPLYESAEKNLNGKYRCKIYNSVGLVTSDEAVLHAYDHSSITSQPASRSININTSVSFHITASGDLISYQWQKKGVGDENWSDISGETTDTLTFTAVEADNGSQYRCIVIGEYETETSNAATLTVVLRPITISGQPTNQSVQVNDPVSFHITASGDLISYQWQKKGVGDENWSDISGETTDTLTFTAVEADNGSQYRCVVSNREQSVISNAAELSLKLPPRIVNQPESITTVENKNVSFVVNAIGYSLLYQWQFSSDNGITWSDIRNSNSSSLNVIATLSLNGYKYRCVVTNDLGTATSDTATLTVTADTSVSKPTIASQPSSTTVAEGSNATFAVTASGEDLHYQWQIFKNNQWQSITGETNSSYVISATRGLDKSKYRCIVSNAAGAVYSNEATLTVSSGVYVSTPTVLTHPKSVNVDLGDVVTFWVRADGGSLTYQWQKFNNNSWYDITGAVGNTYTLTARTEIHNTRYRCVITNTAGSVYSNSATLSIRAGQDLSFYGYHSIIISGKNTYGEWEMYPTSRPHVAPPEVKTSYVDLPGADGGLDYTDLLTGEPRYGYRKGSWEFLLIPQDKWASVYRSLVSFLHGRQHTVILEDDPDYVYTGRLSVNEWQSAAHNSLITIDYILEPHARNISGEEENAREAEILDAANELLSKVSNAGMVIAKVSGEAALVDPSMLFEDGDNIAY